MLGPVARQLFADNAAKDMFSEHTNMLAVLFDVAPKKDQPKSCAKSSARSDRRPSPPATDLIGASFYFRYYLARALDHAGMADEYLKTLGRLARLPETGFHHLARTTRRHPLRLPRLDRASHLRLTNSRSRHPTRKPRLPDRPHSPALRQSNSSRSHLPASTRPDPCEVRRISSNCRTARGTCRYISMEKQGNQAPRRIELPEIGITGRNKLRSLEMVRNIPKPHRGCA
jgi:hypothetical protein